MSFGRFPPRNGEGDHAQHGGGGPRIRCSDAGPPPPPPSAAVPLPVPGRSKGFTPWRRSAEHGFTLVEMLVALAIFSLAAMALLRLEGATVTTTALLREQALAQTVARNLAVEVITDPEPPAFGATRGEAVNAGRKWLWTRIVGRSPEPRIQQIRIEVRSDRGPEAANLTLFRRGAR